jgi:hypothetical protein
MQIASLFALGAYKFHSSIFAPLTHIFFSILVSSIYRQSSQDGSFWFDAGGSEEPGLPSNTNIV